VRRPRLTRLDRLRLLVAARLLPGWRHAIAIVQPDTILRWHRLGFRLFWRHRTKSAAPPRLSAETVALIREMAANNRLWGAERIRGEVLKLGIPLSKRTIPKYVRQVREHRRRASLGRRFSTITPTPSGRATSSRATIFFSGPSSSSSSSILARAASSTSPPHATSLVDRQACSPRYGKRCRFTARRSRRRRFACCRSRRPTRSVHPDARCGLPADSRSSRDPASRRRHY
jgi:hypothetical protein